MGMYDLSSEENPAVAALFQKVILDILEDKHINVNSFFNDMIHYANQYQS